jgi:hypothetical protein
MRRVFVALVVSVQIGLVSCSLAPDQSDVTRVDTMDIVHNIRCETKEALLAYPPDHWVHRATVAYAFEFRSVENNGLGGGASIVVPITNGAFTLDVIGAVQKQREGEHRLTLGEPFFNLHNLDCSETAHRRSFKYPITGHIGTAVVIGQFVEFGSLSGITYDHFSRRLRYRLLATGGLRPSVAIVPAPGQRRNFNLDVNASREDIHQVHMTFEPPATARPGAKGRALVQGVPGDGVNRALRSLERERSLRIQEQILERLPP